VLSLRSPRRLFGRRRLLVSRVRDQANSSGRREGHERPGFVRLEPAALDREFEARAVLGWAAAVTEEKRLVDFLNVDAPLNRLDRIGDFEDAARGLLWIGKGAGGKCISSGAHSCGRVAWSDSAP
jgi:hypothetical protein